MKIDFVAIVGVSIISAALILLIKDYRPELAVLLSIGAGAFILLSVFGHLITVIDSIKAMWERTGISPVYIQTLIKCLGICYITQLASDACKDAGQAAIAGKVELAGKISIIIISLPLFTSLIDLILDLIAL